VLLKTLKVLNETVFPFDMDNSVDDSVNVNVGGSAVENVDEIEE
jgi:hypothetical protein